MPPTDAARLPRGWAAVLFADYVPRSAGRPAAIALGQLCGGSAGAISVVELLCAYAPDLTALDGPAQGEGVHARMHALGRGANVGRPEGPRPLMQRVPTSGSLTCLLTQTAFSIACYQV